MTAPSKSKNKVNKQKTIKIKVIDSATNQEIRQQLLYGYVGEKIEYNPKQLMKVLGGLGYKEVDSNWPGKVRITNNQEYRITVKKQLSIRQQTLENSKKEKIVSILDNINVFEKKSTDQSMNRFIKDSRRVDNTPNVILAQKLNYSGAGSEGISDLEKIFFALAETTSFGVR